MTAQANILAKGAVVATLDAAIASDKLAELYDELGVEHKLQGKLRRLDEKVMALSGEAFDVVLLQKPQSTFDALLLCLIAHDRDQLIYDALDDDLRLISDAIASAMIGVGGWLATQCVQEQLQSIPDRYRGTAEDWLGNFIGVAPAQEIFQK